MFNFNTGIQPTKPVTNIIPHASKVRTLPVKPGDVSHLIIYGLFSHLQAGGNYK
jgi:hypothetical protein